MARIVCGRADSLQWHVWYAWNADSSECMVCERGARYTWLSPNCTEIGVIWCNLGRRYYYTYYYGSTTEEALRAQQMGVPAHVIFHTNKRTGVSVAGID